MTIAEKYLEQQLKDPEFKLHYLNEKGKLDIEYMLEELKLLSRQAAKLAKNT